MMKKISIIILGLILLLHAVSAEAADTFTVMVPANTEVTMQDPNEALPFTITNNSASKYIREITFQVDTGKYNISSATVPPTGWCVKDVTTSEITFSLQQASGACSNGQTGSQIAPGGSSTFNITVLPLAASSDIVNDTLTTVTIGSQGGLTLSGSLPAWTRRSLEASLTATPSSAGVGDEITLTMQVTNRSTATQTLISTDPSPPSYSSAIVTYSGGPYYGSTSLSGDHTASASIITVASTGEFPSSGTVKIESEEICYTGKTATTFTGVTRGCNSTTAAAHTSGSSVYSLNAFSLSAGETRTVVWTYTAQITGSVYFTASARNGSGTAKSKTVNSNTVVIGDFTAAMSLSPSRVISGQNVTVLMTVKNNGSTALVNVIPSALTACAGGAAETLVSGPSPSGVSTLAAGSSAVFSWTYGITGSVGQSYCLSGSASANGPVTTNTITTNTGTISDYSVTVAPSIIQSGAANVTLTWTVYNGSGCSVQEVDVDTPAGGGDWSCSSVSYPSGWSGGCSNMVQFTSGGGANDIASGGTKSFSITFSTTETVTSDKVAEFPVTLTARGCGGSTDTLGSYVTIVANGLTLAHTPAGPIYADGSSFYTMTATLTSGGVPVAGKTVTFTTTNGSLSPSSAVTDANGEAAVSLVAPNSTTDTSATVTASYLSASDDDAVSFTGWTKPSLQYWGGLGPVSADCGSAYSFTMNVRNISGASSMTIGTGSYFAFNDSSTGGSAVFIAYLDSPATIGPGVTQALTFGSPTSSGGGGGVSVSSGFMAGTYSPTANSSPPPQSGLFFTDGGTNDQYRSVTDNITLTGACGTVKVHIIEWHEMP